MTHSVSSSNRCASVPSGISFHLTSRVAPKGLHRAHKSGNGRTQWQRLIDTSRRTYLFSGEVGEQEPPRMRDCEQAAPSIPPNWHRRTPCRCESNTKKGPYRSYVHGTSKHGNGAGGSELQLRICQDMSVLDSDLNPLVISVSECEEFAHSRSGVVKLLDVSPQQTDPGTLRSAQSAQGVTMAVPFTCLRLGGMHNVTPWVTPVHLYRFAKQLPVLY